MKFACGFFPNVFRPSRSSRTTFGNLFFQSAADYEGVRHERTVLARHLDDLTREISVFFLFWLCSSLLVGRVNGIGLISCTRSTSTSWYLRIFESRKNSITVVYSLSLQGHCQSNLLKLHPLSPDETSVWVTRLINNKCRCFPNFYCMRWLQFFNHKYLKATEKYLVFQTVFSGALRINRSVHSLA